MSHSYFFCVQHLVQIVFGKPKLSLKLIISHHPNSIHQLALPIHLTPGPMEVCPHCCSSFKRRGGLSLHLTWSSECRKVRERTQQQDECILFDNDINTGDAPEQCSPTATPPTHVFERPERPTHQHESSVEDFCYDHDTSTMLQDKESGQVGVQVGVSESIARKESFLQIDYGCTEQMWSFLPSMMEANNEFIVTNTENIAAPVFPITDIETAAMPMVDGRSDTTSHMDDESDPWFGTDHYTVDEVVQIDLLRTLRALKVPLKTYDAVMGCNEILKQIDSNMIPCHTEVKKSDGEGGWETYRAHPKFYGEQWNDFVLIKWSTEREPLPARIHTFLKPEDMHEPSHKPKVN